MDSFDIILNSIFSTSGACVIELLNQHTEDGVVSIPVDAERVGTSNTNGGYCVIA